MKSILAVTVALSLAACDDGPTAPVPEVGTPQLATTTVNHFSTTFSATAMCPASIGRIAFTGTIEGVDQTTVDENGETHRTRAFRVQGLSGTNLDFGTTYTVLGGAEMLTWQTQLGQTPGLGAKSLHAGTLVFEPVAGGSVVIAHHAIRYIENADGEPVVEYSSWSCRTR